MSQAKTRGKEKVKAKSKASPRVDPKAKPKQRFTVEHQVYAAIASTYPSPTYAVLPGVSDATGGNARRTLDAMIMGIWPSRGLHLQGVEIKCSRSDLLRELKDPAKQEPHFRYCDYFWLAVGDASIVNVEEVPEMWGLMVPSHKKGLMKVVKKAPKLSPVPMDRRFLAAIMRRVHEQRNDPAMERRVEERVREKYEDRIKSLEAMAAQVDLARSEQTAKQIEKVREFEEASGIVFNSWYNHEEDVRLLKAIKQSRTQYLPRGLEGVRAQLMRLTECVEEGITLAKAVLEPDEDPPA